MKHIYSNEFFDYIDAGARQSAQRMIHLVQPWLNAQSVVDLGSGRGVWLHEWMNAGVSEVLAADGDYVDRDRLAVPAESFHACDLTQPLDLGRRYDLAQSLEVGEHLPNSASETLVESLTRHSDRVLFSAAVPGQGGEFHINERPLAFWQGLFADQGYSAFDCVRPALKDDDDVENWYRYNTILYVNEAGRKTLPQEVLTTEVPAGTQVQNRGHLAWRLRRVVVAFLPRSLVTKIAQMRAARLVRRAQGQNA